MKGTSMLVCLLFTTLVVLSTCQYPQQYKRNLWGDSSWIGDWTPSYSWQDAWNHRDTASWWYDTWDYSKSWLKDTKDYTSNSWWGNQDWTWHPQPVEQKTKVEEKSKSWRFLGAKNPTNNDKKRNLLGVKQAMDWDPKLSDWDGPWDSSMWSAGFARDGDQIIGEKFLGDRYYDLGTVQPRVVEQRAHPVMTNSWRGAATVERSAPIATGATFSSGPVYSGSTYSSGPVYSGSTYSSGPVYSGSSFGNSFATSSTIGAPTFSGASYGSSFSSPVSYGSSYSAPTTSSFSPGYGSTYSSGFGTNIGSSFSTPSYGSSWGSSYAPVASTGYSSYGGFGNQGFTSSYSGYSSPSFGNRFMW